MEVVAIHDTNVPINNIHPPHKLPVGNRLAAMALNRVYDQDVVATGPSFTSATRSGVKVVIRFTDIDQGLSTKDGAAPSWIELSADGQQFVSAEAVIQGDTVVVHATDVPNPQFVRMGWYDTAIPNLQDTNGWPVFAFPAQSVR